MSCQGTFAYVLPTFSSRWNIAPWAFDPVHCNDPTTRFPTAETSILQVSAVGNLAVGSLKWTGSAIVHCLWSLLKATLNKMRG